MRASQLFWDNVSLWSDTAVGLDRAGLVFYFGTRQMLADGKLYDSLRLRFPKAHILGCSTGGQLARLDVSDDTACALALDFDATELRVAHAEIAGSA